MTDKEFTTQKRRVETLIKKWKDNLGLGWWNITWVWEREHDDEDTKNSHTAGRCQTQWEYKNAVVTFYLPSVAELDAHGLERIFVHECMHILVSPMAKKGADEKEELTATMLADAFLWTAGVKK